MGKVLNIKHQSYGDLRIWFCQKCSTKKFSIKDNNPIPHTLRRKRDRAHLISALNVSYMPTLWTILIAFFLPSIIILPPANIWFFIIHSTVFKLYTIFQLRHQSVAYNFVVSHKFSSTAVAAVGCCSRHAFWQTFILFFFSIWWLHSSILFIIDSL